jgi:hypothetical protein
MPNRISFSGQHLALSDIAAHQQDLQSSLTLFFSDVSPAFPVRFAGYLKTEISEQLEERLEETGLSSSLLVLASVEAAFRIDYLQRCYHKDKAPISRCFRAIHKKKQLLASLDEDIFEAWLTYHNTMRPLIGELRGAFRFRHWLAHGRYWTPKLGRRYDYAGVYTLADETLNSFPFFGYAV